MTLDGRAYSFVHTGRHAAELRRDRRRIARVLDADQRRRPTDAQPLAIDRGTYLVPGVPLDRTDELAVALFVALCGPAGRSGALRRIASAVWWDATNP